MAEEAHGTPVDGSECLACMEDLSSETYVEYATEEGGAWRPALYCSNCVEHLRQNQFKQYTHQLANTTCKAEQRRLLARGPPVYVFDKTALPVEDGQDVKLLWYSFDQQVRSAKLEGALEGDERIQWWEDQKKFIIQDEPDEPGDERGEAEQQQSA